MVIAGHCAQRCCLGGDLLPPLLRSSFNLMLTAVGGIVVYGVESVHPAIFHTIFSSAAAFRYAAEDLPKATLTG